MKILRLFFLILIYYGCIISCSTNQNISAEEIVKAFFVGYNTSNFDAISKCVTDSVVTVEMDFVLTNDRQELYTHFSWDSVFMPKYKIITVETNMDTVVVTASKICNRIKYLHDVPTVYKANFIIESNKIVKVQTTEFLVFDYKLWESRRDSLVTWIDENHRELKDFQYDLTSDGAHKYLNAIDLYENRAKTITQ